MATAQATGDGGKGRTTTHGADEAGKSADEAAAASGGAKAPTADAAGAWVLGARVLADAAEWESVPRTNPSME